MTQAVPEQSFPKSFKRDLLAGKKLWTLALLWTVR